VNGPVHTMIGLSTGIAGATLLSDKLPVITESPLGPSCFVIAIVSGSVFPDLDLPGRPLGFLGHRRLTHTLLFPAIAVVIMIMLKGTHIPELASIVRALLFGWIWGYVLHIIADLFQKRGVPLFWPVIPANVHLANMPVKYDKICLIIYLIILCYVCVTFGNLSYNILDFLKTSPSILIAVVIAIIEIKKSLFKSMR